MYPEEIKKEFQNGKILKLTYYSTTPNYILHKYGKYVFYETSVYRVAIYPDIHVIKGKNNPPFKFISKAQFLLETLKLEMEAPIEYKHLLFLGLK